MPSGRYGDLAGARSNPGPIHPCAHCSTSATSRQSLVQAPKGKSVRPGGLKGGCCGVRSATYRAFDCLPCPSQRGGASSRGLLPPDAHEQLPRRQETVAAPPAVYEPGDASVICSVSSFAAVPCFSDPLRHIPCADFLRTLPTPVKGRLDIPRHCALVRITGRRILADCA